MNVISSQRMPREFTDHLCHGCGCSIWCIVYVKQTFQDGTVIYLCEPCAYFFAGAKGILFPADSLPSAAEFKESGEWPDAWQPLVKAWFAKWRLEGGNTDLNGDFTPNSWLQIHVAAAVKELTGDYPEIY
jgi:hypothetical protein